MRYEYMKGSEQRQGNKTNWIDISKMDRQKTHSFMDLNTSKDDIYRVTWIPNEWSEGEEKSLLKPYIRDCS